MRRVLRMHALKPYSHVRASIKPLPKAIATLINNVPWMILKTFCQGCNNYV